MIRDQVALTDGAAALQPHMQTAFPPATLGLDIIHASEYRWDAANALWGETHPQRTGWVRQHLHELLAGHPERVITALEQVAADPTTTGVQREALRRTSGTIGAINRIWPMISTWRTAGPLARAWSKGHVGSW